MEMLMLCEDVRHEHLVEIINCCFSCSDLFTLTRFGGHAVPQTPPDPIRLEKFRASYKMHDRVLSALGECRVGTIKSKRWALTSTVPYMYIDLYQSSERAKDTILSFYDDFYMSPSDCKIELPADICFFKNGVCWMVSCSHEEMCYALPENQAITSVLMQHGVWQRVPESAFPLMPVLADYEITK